MSYLFTTYPEHSLSLDVSTDNDTALKFYRKNGLRIRDIYLSVPDNVEFALFETPVDCKGRKIDVSDPDIKEKQVHPYYFDASEFKMAKKLKKEEEEGKAQLKIKAEESADTNSSDVEQDQIKVKKSPVEKKEEVPTVKVEVPAPLGLNINAPAFFFKKA